MIRIRWGSFFLNAQPLRALLEAALFGLLLAALLWLSTSHSLDPMHWFPLEFVFLAPGAMGYFALRARVPAPPWWRRWLQDLLAALLLSVPFNLLYLCGVVLSSFRGAGSYSLRIYIFILFILTVVDLFGFVVWRAFVRLVVFWDRLRRTRLLWALTNSHIMLVVMGAGLLIGAFDFLAFFLGSDNIPLILSATAGMVFLTAIALLIVIPPSALFSYLVMRRITERLRLLATGTHALRAGNYSVRIPVSGEDEVAQLQADFNAMAADLERAMRELQMERDTVAGLLKLRRELIAGVSHELRTPVATMRGYLESTLDRWQQGTPPPTLHHDLEVMQDEVLRLQALVEDLFALSRSEVGRLTLRCVPTDVGLLTRRVVETRAPLAWRSSRVEVSADTPSEGPIALVDPKRLQQALQNLLHNGVRHTPPGGIVAVTLGTENDMVVLQVKDTGEGIAPTELPHIWERFYQASSSAHRGGSGLGLSLVKEWVEAMHGSVAVESVLGQGSCFTLRLPLARKEDLSSTLRLPESEHKRHGSLPASQQSQNKKIPL